MENFKITSIGLMSGTSLDGLDVCCTTFNRIDGKWTFHIDAARGYGYPEDMKWKLGIGAQQMSALEFVTFHSEYGKFLGERVREFIEEFGVNPDIIASHGHTIFHEPHKRIMYQIGDGAAIAAEAAGRLDDMDDDEYDNIRYAEEQRRIIQKEKQHWNNSIEGD